MIRAIVLTVLAPAMGGEAVAHEPLNPRLDTAGPYLILATEKAQQDFQKAIAAAKLLHSKATTATFAPDDLAGAKKTLLAQQPRYVLLFLKQEELECELRQWLTLSTQLNDDPLVDMRTGIIMGASPEDATAFIERISAAVSGKTHLPALFIDNLGPNPQAGKLDFQKSAGSFLIPVRDQRLATSVNLARNRGLYEPAFGFHATNAAITSHQEIRGGSATRFLCNKLDRVSLPTRRSLDGICVEQPTLNPRFHPSLNPNHCIHR